MSAAAQLTSGGIQPPQPTDRLFFAVFPDHSTAAEITRLAQSLRRELHLQGKLLRPERLHVTLHFLGDYAGLPPDLVGAAQRAAGQVEARAFDVSFDRVASFPARSHKHPVVLRGGAALESLQAFQRQLLETMAGIGMQRFSTREFIPHVTLLYDRKTLESLPTQPIKWTIRDFSLVHSSLADEEYRIIGSWPLLAAPPAASE